MTVDSCVKATPPDHASRTAQILGSSWPCAISKELVPLFSRHLPGPLLAAWCLSGCSSSQSCVRCAPRSCIQVSSSSHYPAFRAFRLLPVSPYHAGDLDVAVTPQAAACRPLCLLLENRAGICLLESVVCPLTEDLFPMPWTDSSQVDHSASPALLRIRSAHWTRLFSSVILNPSFLYLTHDLEI